MSGPPKPLTAPPPARLDFSRPTGPLAVDFDDIYYSVEGGLDETRNVYLAGCAMPQIWTGHSVFTVGELGFGTGLNFLALWQMWKRHRPSPDARLTVISVEGFPLSKAELTRALEPWEELKDFAGALIERWPGRVKGRHVLEFEDGVTLVLCHDQVENALRGIHFSADSWFLDGFSPAKNPQMWSPDIMQQIFDHSADGARIGTFTVAGAVVRALKSAGFEVVKREGFGKKRHRLEAVKPSLGSRNSSRPRPVIIGAGIAGASLSRSFLRRGIIPTILDPGLGDGSSFNPLAIVKPRLDLQDRPESRFFLSAYLYALRLYGEAHIAARGAGHMARTQNERRRFLKLTEQAALPADHMRFADKDAFHHLTGIKSDFGGLWFKQAPHLRPEGLIREWLKGAKQVGDKVMTIDHGSVYAEGGRLICQGSDIIITAGAGAITLAPDLPLSPIRGQIDWGGQSPMGLKSAVSYDGYAAPYDGGVLLGATHDRGVESLEARPVDRQRNISGFERIKGRAPQMSHSRASIRVGASEGLPIAKTLGPGLHIITALAGRGFSHAPLLAEQMAAKICGDYLSDW